MDPLTQLQRSIIQSPIGKKTFLEGPAGTGKTTVGVERMLYLMESGIPGHSILVFLPQLTLAKPYQDALNSPGVVAGGRPTISTISGLAQRMIELFWPLIAKRAGFAHPDQPPVYLNHETAQYYVAYLIRPLIKEGMFGSVTIARNRIYGQILDNLNKAAVIGFPHTEIGSRLKSAWSGEPGQANVYTDAQTCAVLFRQFCLDHNLLDFSLQIDVFRHQLCQSTLCREYLWHTYRHLVIDHIEEDVPVSHDMLSDWLPRAESAMVIFDHEAGYRRFLGADPLSALGLKAFCTDFIEFNQSFVTSPGIQSLKLHLESALQHKAPASIKVSPRLALTFETHNYYPQMLDWVVSQIENLVSAEGTQPKDIVILAPILSDSLRFSLVNRLEQKQIPVKTHRPSRSLREEPATACLLTLASIAHPEWGFLPAKFDVAHSLMQAIPGLDLIRARILTDIVYRPHGGIPKLLPFDQIIPSSQERITYLAGERYDHLRLWIEEYQGSTILGLDYFISRLFGEILSQPGYGFHNSFDMGQVTAHLVESIRNFRRAAGENLSQAGIPLGREYITMVNEGILAAQYIPRWQAQEENAVFIAPAYTFLTNNYPVEVQFWLDVGNFTWAERLYQPLTHPYVLSRNWEEGKTWTDVEEVETSNQGLNSLIVGLLNRCKRSVYLGLSEYNEQGYEQRGPLLQAFHRMLQSLDHE